MRIKTNKIKSVNQMNDKNEDMKQELKENLDFLQTKVTSGKFKAVMVWGIACFITGYLLNSLIMRL